MRTKGGDTAAEAYASAASTTSSVSLTISQLALSSSIELSSSTAIVRSKTSVSAITPWQGQAMIGLKTDKNRLDIYIYVAMALFFSNCLEKPFAPEKRVERSDSDSLGRKEIWSQMAYLCKTLHLGPIWSCGPIGPVAWGFCRRMGGAVGAII